MRYFAVSIALALSVSACGSNLDHEAPYDPDSPAAKQAKASVSGRILLDGESDHSQVTVLLKGGERTYTTQTLEDGSVELNGVVPGTYSLAVFTRYFEPISETAVVELGKTLDLGERTLEAKKAAVTGSATLGKLDGASLIMTGGVQLVLTKIASVRGGAGTAPASRFAMQAASVAVTITTNSSDDGQYAFNGVPAGKYLLTAENDDGPGADVTVTVTGEDGDVTVDDIVLEPLTGFFTIAGTPAGDYTRVPDVELAITGFQTVSVKIGQSSNGAASGCTYPGGAVPYTALRSYSLLADGLNTVCVVFIDQGGNESDPVLRTITLDRAKPGGSMLIDNGAAFSADAAGLVTLTFNATSAYSALDAIKVADLTVGSCAAALAATTSVAYVSSLSRFLVPAGAGVEGDRTVCAAFGNVAGNWSDPVSDTVRYDLRRPAGDLTLAAAVTNDTRIGVTLSYDADTAAMRLGSGSSCSSGVWSEPSTSTDWNLAALDGPQQVSVQYRDAAGNLSDCITRTVTLDRQGPVPSAFQVGGNGVQPLYSRQRQVSVTVNTNAPDCAKVELSEDSGFAFGVQSSAACTLSAAAFTLEDREGLHTVYVRYTDTLGNVGPSVGANVVLDSAEPSAAISINNGAASTSEPIGNVNLRLTSASANSPLDRMKIANLTAGTCTAALAATTATGVQNNVPWTLADAGNNQEGERYVCYSVSNMAGTWSTPVSDSVYYDRLAPTGGVAFGATVTSDTLVAVTLSYSAGAVSMKLSGDPSCGPGQWVEASTSAIWNLPGFDGVQSVSAQFRDAAGNVSACYSDTITLDRTGPNPAAFMVAGNGVNPMYAGQVTLSVSASSAAADCASTEFAEDPGFVLSTASYPSCSLVGSPYELIDTSQGARTLYARFVDALGNVGPVAVASFVFDTIAPQSATLTVDRGALTNQSNVTLLVGATGADQMQVAAGAACAGAWTGFLTNVPQTLSAGDGPYPFAVRLRDLAGNQSACLTQTVVLDQTVSPYAVAVTGADGGTAATLSQLVAVSLSGVDSDVVEMKVSNLPNLGDASWVPVETTFAWLLQSGDGTRTVYVRLKDQAGNERQAQASITLDQTPPAVPVLAAADNDGDGFALASNHVELTWSSSAAPDLKGYRLERLISAPGATFQVIAASLPATATTFTDSSAGLNGKSLYYRIRAEDVLGNVSAYSNMAPAETFAPASGAQIIHRSGTTTVKFKVPPGVFSVQTDRSWVRPDLVKVTQALAANKAEFELPAAPAGVWNDSLRVRMLNRNQDLAYEQVIYLDDRRLVQVNEGIMPQACAYYGLDVDGDGKPHIQWANLSAGLEVRYASFTSQETFQNTVLGSQNQTQISMRVDRFGRTHMVWKETWSGVDYIRYARIATDGTPFVTTIPSLTPPPTAYYPQLDVDDTGRAHVTFYGGAYTLQYSRIGPNDTAFEVGYVNHWAHVPEIRVIANGLYIIAHAAGGWDFPIIWKDNLDDLTLSGGYWNFEGDTLWLPDNQINEEVNLEVDGQGNLHLISSVSGLLQQTVGYPIAGSFGAGWTGFQSFAAQGLPVASGTIEMGPLMSDDEPVIKDGGDLWVKQNGVWQKHTMLQGAFRNNSKGRIIRDAENRLHTVSCGFDGRLWYARSPAAEIFPAKVSDEVGIADAGFSHDLAVGPGDRPHILYMNRTTNTVEYAHLDAYGTWTTEVVETGTGELRPSLPDFELGYHMALAIGGGGAVHAVYEAERPGNEVAVHYAYRDPVTGGWSVADLGQGFYPAVTVANGQIAIAFTTVQPGRYPLLIYTGPEAGPLSVIDPQIDIEDTGAYGTPGTPNYLPRHANIQFDAQGHLHLAAGVEMFGNGYYLALRYMTNRSGAWVSKRYDPCCFHGWWPSLGVTPDGSKAYITHYMFGGNYEYLTTFDNDTGDASTLSLGAEERGGLSELVVDRLGYPYVALIDYTRDQLLFDFFDGNQWTETVTRQFATDLVPSAAGSPWAPYGPADNEFGLRHRLAIDGKNRVHQTYYDVDRGKLVYLYPQTNQHAQPALQTRLVPPS